GGVARVSQEQGRSQKATLSLDAHAAGSPIRDGSAMSPVLDCTGASIPAPALTLTHTAVKLLLITGHSNSGVTRTDAARPADWARFGRSRLKRPTARLQSPTLD